MDLETPNGCCGHSFAIKIGAGSFIYLIYEKNDHNKRPESF